MDGFDRWMRDQGASDEQVEAARADDSPSERAGRLPRPAGSFHRDQVEEIEVLIADAMERVRRIEGSTRETHDALMVLKQALQKATATRVSLGSDALREVDS